MAKGKPSSKITKDAKGRKNHGPKRHLHHDIEPKALRMDIARSGALSKYDDFDSFCLSMQARGVRADFRLLWDRFCSIKMLTNEDGELVPNRAAQRDFFANAREIGKQLMSQRNAKGKGAKA